METGRYVIGVSESVPSYLRDYFVLAAYIQSQEIGMDVIGTVLKAEKKTLELVPDRHKLEYVDRRTELFRRTLALGRRLADRIKLHESEIKEYEANLDFLVNQIEQRARSYL